jgi:NADPH:quinone reductase-like Zn-dependent oxidoreductase
LGADEVIDYKKEKFEDKIKDIDLVYDTVGGDTQKRSIKVLKNGGRLITTVQLEVEEEAKAKNITALRYGAKVTPNDLQQMAKVIDEGKVKPQISKTFPLEQAKEAQKLSEEGHTRGKIVIQVVK